MDEYETILLVKPEASIYKIPAKTKNTGYRAADWNLDKPDWIGRLKLVSKNNCLLIRLEDKSTAQLFAECPVDNYPGVAVEQVVDSSRYFVIRVQEKEGGRSAFLGIGFSDRSDSFDLNVALTDHFKRISNNQQIQKEKQENKPELDLRFKEGQTIKIHMNFGTNASEHRSHQRVNKDTTFVSPNTEIKLPPPPGFKTQNPVAPYVQHTSSNAFVTNQVSRYVAA